MKTFKFLRALALVIIKIFYRCEIHGRENEPKEGGFIAFSNHSSFPDPLFTACSMKRPLYFLGKSDLQKNRIMKWLFKIANVVAINRGESDIAALRKSCEIVARGDSVAIYPQGTRIATEAPETEQALPGIGLMAMRTKATLVPVTICYGKKNKKPMIFRKVHVYIGKPITYEEYSALNEKPSSRDIAFYSFSKLCEDFNKYNHD